jgi:hypothetical protein
MIRRLPRLGKGAGLLTLSAHFLNLFLMRRLTIRARAKARVPRGSRVHVPFGRRLRLARNLARDIWRKFSQIPQPARLTLVGCAIAVAFAATNLAYQIIEKPAELLYPVRHVLDKTPKETWREYGSVFRKYSTATISPELLAALAQTEGAGNPIAHTYWRWRLSMRPLSIYRPASSAVGMYQMTDPAFSDARHYCIRNHAVVDHGCWPSSLYSRIIPSDAIELVAVFLDRGVADVLRQSSTSRGEREEVAIVIHLCGEGPAKAFAQRGFHFGTGERCGDHSAAAYVSRVNAFIKEFRSYAIAK